MKTYARMFLIVFVLIGLVIVGVGLNLEPLSGDLTRTGGYSENDYGWNGVHYGFDRRLFFTGSQNDYDRYYDVVVFGDSFSLAFSQPREKEPGPVESPISSWNNFFANDTGLSMAVFRVEEIDEVIDSPAFRESPPRLIFYETIEREIVNLTRDRDASCIAADPPRGPLLSQHPLGLERVPHERTTHHLKGILDFDSTVSFINGWTKRRTGLGSVYARDLGLNTNSLFTNTRPDRVLVWYEDLAKSQFTRTELEHAYCVMLDLQTRCQQSGRTLFVAMVMPDKLSAYQRHLSESQAIYDYVLHRVPPPETLNHPPIADAIIAAVDRGEPDIYLSNDTHLSWKGNQIVSDTVVDYLVDGHYLLPDGAVPELTPD